MAAINQTITFFNDEIGRVGAGYKIYSYEKGTSTPKLTYTDESLTDQNPWPLVANARGIFPQSYGTGQYTFVYKDADDVEFETRDYDANLGSEGLSVIVFDTVADMIIGQTSGGSIISLSVDQICMVMGYTNATDGVGAMFRVQDAGPSDDFQVFELNNGLIARRLNNFYNGIGVLITDTRDGAYSGNYRFDNNTVTDKPPIDDFFIPYELVNLNTERAYASNISVQRYNYATDSSGSFSQLSRVQYGEGGGSGGWYHTAGRPIYMNYMPTNDFAQLFSGSYYGGFQPSAGTLNSPFSSLTGNEYFHRPFGGCYVTSVSANDFVVSQSSTIHRYAMKDRQAHVVCTSAGAISRQSAANANQTIPAPSKTGTGVYEFDISGFTSFVKVYDVQVTANGTTCRIANAETTVTNKIIVRTYDAAGAAADSGFNLTITWNF